MNKNGGIMKDYTVKLQAYRDKLKKTFDAVSLNEWNTLMNLLEQACDEGRQIFIMGNGGSAATASHYVCDFNKGASYGKEKRFKMICLNDNFPTMMAYANDVSYEQVFVEPMKNFFNEGDLVIGISGSGNSMNVVNAIDWANQHGGVTVSLTGYSGGKLKEISQYQVHVPVNDMQITEDVHMILCHGMMQILGGYC